MTRRILIIDDDERGTTTMTRRLSNYGYDDVMSADNGEEGLGVAKLEIIHLAIIMTELSDMSGFDACQQIKEIREEETKVILMTGLSEMVNVERAIDAGADDYVVKTSDYLFLMDAVKKLLPFR